jgi:hypothetical protein
VFENRVLRRIFGPKRDEVTGKKKCITRSLLYSSPSIVRMMKSSRMRWTKHVAQMGRRVTGVKARRKETTRRTIT